MNVAEFAQRYRETTFEWINGEEIELDDLPLVLEKILRRLADKLVSYTDAVGTGEVLTHTPFVLLDSSGDVRDTLTPDLSLYSAGHALKDDSGVLLAHPDLAVEIMPRPDEIPIMYRKILGYLKMGVQQVWLIDPDMQTLSIYRQGTKEIVVLGTRHRMLENPLFPGLEIDIVNLFE